MLAVTLKKKGQGLPLSTIIIFIIVLVVLVIIILFFTQTSGSLFGVFRDRANATIDLANALPK